MSDTTFLYFAYGSNMSLRRLRHAQRAPSAHPLGTARLAAHRLVFDKHGRDGSAKADCEPTGDAAHAVLGGLFVIDAVHRTALDRVESGYTPTVVEVLADGGPVHALTYVAGDRHAGLLPFTWYLRHVLEGARELALPTTYLCAIEQIETRDDHDAARAVRELALYSS